MVMTDIETKLRPFTFEDAQACVDLFNACSQRLNGCDNSELDDLISEWTSPGLDASKMIQVVEDLRMARLSDISMFGISPARMLRNGSGAFSILIIGMMAFIPGCCPGQKTWRVNALLLRLDGARVIMKQGTDSKDKQRKHALESHGFDLVRHFYRMQIELDRPPQASKIPKGLRDYTPSTWKRNWKRPYWPWTKPFRITGAMSPNRKMNFSSSGHTFWKMIRISILHCGSWQKRATKLRVICRCSGKTVKIPTWDGSTSCACASPGAGAASEWPCSCAPLIQFYRTRQSPGSSGCRCFQPDQRYKAL